jgi:predicted type IV restriction endonuclease
MDQADSVHSTPHVCNLRRHRRGAVMSEEIERIVRIRRARNTPKSNMETRVALIVAERGLTEKQLAKYFVRRRKNCNRRWRRRSMKHRRVVHPTQA